jgi:hypothetical protein
MTEISKDRVIDWDNQLRKERDLKSNLGESWTLSQVKELTGSFRRLVNKDKDKIGKGILVDCEEFYLSLDAIGRNAYSEICKSRSSAHFAIKRGDEKYDSDPALKEFISWDEKLQSFKKNNGYKDISN